MKWVFIIAIIVACTSLLVINIAFAQEPEPTPQQIELSNLFTWTKTTPPDWGRGALFAGLGVIGALVTIFGFIGGAVPGTAGQAKIDVDTERLDRLSQRLEELITVTTPDAAAIAAVENTVNNLRDDLRAERWRQFGIAAVVYVILGAFFSTLLAQDMLQALVIGAGWTVSLGTLGLKKDYSERKAAKDATLEKTLERVKKTEEIVRGTGDGNLIASLSSDPYEVLEKEVRLHQRL